MRVQLVDPSAYTPPYDHALARGLARAGADVELLTGRFLYGPTPPAEGYRVSECFYRRTNATEHGRWARRALKAAEHVPDMMALRARSARADVSHFQWLPLEALDLLLLPPARPRVFTVHNVLRRGEGRARGLVTRMLARRMDALVAHTRAGARELVERFGADPARVHVIPHGVFDYLTRLEHEGPLPAELAAVEGPVILWFGLARPYKGLDVLIEAFGRVEGAELWVVGMPYMAIDSLRAAAAKTRGTVRFVDRFVPDSQVPALFRRADVVALPYRRIDQSGVLHTALAFEKAIVASAVGGFREVAEDHGAVRLVAPGDPAELAEALQLLVSDPAERAAQERRAAAAAAGPYSWDEIGRRTLALYQEMLGK